MGKIHAYFEKVWSTSQFFLNLLKKTIEKKPHYSLDTTFLNLNYTAHCTI